MSKLSRPSFIAACLLCASGLFAQLPAAFADPNAASIDFDTQVIPVLTRFGCNSGACHGAAIGRGGFQLSLFGSKSDNDHLAIVHELEGRRVNLVDPDESVLLRKATETIEHGGGARFQTDSAAYKTLRSWIESGAKRQRSRQLTRLRVSPTEIQLPDVNHSVDVSVIATFDDGTEQDVTAMTVLSSDDSQSVSIDREHDLLTVHRRGEHLVIARFLDQVHPIRLAVPFGSLQQQPTTTAIENESPNNLVDRFVAAKQTQLAIPASPPAEDHEFARRVWLDLAGRLPTLHELDAFVTNTSPNKRERLVDQLLQTEDFAAYWGLKWANALGVDSNQIERQGAKTYHHWLVDLFRQDASWQDAAFGMLTASGDSYVDGRLNFLRSAGGPDGLAESATRVFLGVRLRCANCHDHPLDHWTQDDYHGLAAIFAKLQRGRVVQPADRGEVTHPVTGQAAIPRIPGSHFLSANSDGRSEFASWVTNRDNAYFARAAVNRIWAQLMGRGLIDPVDDIRPTNPASHPKLLQALAKHFADNDFRFRSVIRIICNSNAYGRTSKTIDGNEFDSVYYSHFLSRGLEAEVVANAISDVTGVQIQYGEPNTVNAILLTDNQTASETLDILGRCDRGATCETPGRQSSSLAKVLHFLNGDLLNSRLDDPNGTLQQWLDQIQDDATLIDRLYKRTLSRPTSDSEQQFWAKQLSSAKQADGNWRDAKSRHEFFADLFWGLVTSESFLTNH